MITVDVPFCRKVKPRAVKLAVDGTQATSIATSSSRQMLLIIGLAANGREKTTAVDESAPAATSTRITTSS